MYPVKTPWWLPKLAPGGLLWRGPDTDVPTVYLSFDDGPHPVATPFVLKQLETYGAQATFFCIGKCVAEHPDIFSRIIAAGHSIGNHTYNHLNGWKTTTAAYLDNIAEAARCIPGNLFRPPYGRIRRAQAGALRSDTSGPWTIYMWSLLSGDFDTKLSPEQCLANVLSHISPGDIVVFHDSTKAWDRLRYVLPFVLDYCKEKGWKMAGLPG